MTSDKNIVERAVKDIGEPAVAQLSSNCRAREDEDKQT